MKNLVLVILFSLPLTIWAQGYQLVWEENFDGNSLNPSVWNIEQQVGVWNTEANQELQHYKADNVSVGDDGNGNNCLIITARREAYNGYQFTSGRINTGGKFAFRYGRIEARMKLPDMANGLWPAFWLLGNSTNVWPACGEIDIMEAGHADGIAANKQNTQFGGALHWQHAGNYAGYGTTAEAPTGLNTDYHTFAMEWTPTNISMYLDGSSTPYYSMNVDGADAEEFRDYSMYIILNLAVGGMFPDIYDQAGITAQLPAEMLVDYIRVYQKTGEGEIEGAAPLYGNLGVYVDGTNCENYLDFNFDATLSTTGTTERAGETAKEGTDVLSYNLVNGQAYTVSVFSEAVKNLSEIKNSGSLDVYLKTNSGSDIQIGLGDATGAESMVTLSASSDYNCSRDGSWSRVVIPFTAFTGLDFTQIDDVLLLKGTPSADAYLSIDKVILSNLTANFELFGIFTNNPSITEGFIIDDISGHLYVWNNTMQAIEAAPAYDGTDVLAFSSPATNTWFGYSLTSDAGIDLEQFSNGYLKLALRSSSTDNFWIGVGGANNTEARVAFNNGSDPYGFTRDGQWHRITIPVSDLVAQGLDLSACGNVFMLGGEPYIADVLVDDIYFSAIAADTENTALNPDRNASLIEDDEYIIVSDYYGIYSENPNITKKFLIDDVDGHIYIWNNTLSALNGGSAYDGSEHLYFTSNNVGWYGFGVFSDNALDLSHFESGYLALSLKTTSSADFWVGMQGAAGSEGRITFNAASAYNFSRDGQWHRILIPMSELTAQGLQLFACGNIFMLGGTEISDIAIDDVILTVGAAQPSNPAVDGATGISSTINTEVSVMPNPCVSELICKAQSDITSIELFNQMGKLCGSKANVGSAQSIMPVGHLAPGVYIAVIKLTNEQVIIKKVVKK
jgi:beta-glucanase (GH16 family)